MPLDGGPGETRAEPDRRRGTGTRCADAPGRAVRREGERPSRPRVRWFDSCTARDGLTFHSATHSVTGATAVNCPESSPPLERRPVPSVSVAVDALSARALGRYLLCGDWSETSGALVRDAGLPLGAPVTAEALTRAAARWHAARALITRTVETSSGSARVVALAGVLLEVRESLGTWTLVQALLDRHAGTPAGRALDPALRAEASALARAWREGAGAPCSGERDAA